MIPAGEHDRLERVCIWCLGVYTLIFVSWTFLHWGGDPTTVSDWASWPVAAGAGVMCWRRSRRLEGRRKLAWLFLAGVCASWLGGEVLWFYLEVVRHTTPFPSVADVLYLVFYPLTFVGLACMPFFDARSRDRLTWLLDSAVVMVTASMVIWHLIIQPEAVDPRYPFLTKVLVIGYPVGDLVLLIGIVRLLVRYPRRGSAAGVRLLGAGVVFLVLADVMFARQDLTGSYHPGTTPDALWVSAFFLVFAAASVTEIQPQELRLGGARFERVSALPFASVFVGLGLLIHEAPNPSVGSRVSLSIGMFVVTALVVVRQITLQRDNERLAVQLRDERNELVDSESRFRELADSAYDPVWRVLFEPEPHFDYLNPAFERVTGYTLRDFERNPELILATMHPQDRELAVAANRGEEIPSVADMRITRPDGTMVVLEQHVTPITGGLQGISRDVTEIRANEAKLSDVAFRDSLTGLANSRLVNEFLDGALRRAKRAGTDVAVAFLDLNKFKTVNDTYGHSAGDMVLQVCAHRLGATIRSSDIVGRVGGDEFVIIFDPATREVANVLERISESLNDPIELDDQTRLSCTASIGIADTRTIGFDRKALLRAADTAMYQIKSSAEGSRTALAAFVSPSRQG